MNGGKNNEKGVFSFSPFIFQDLVKKKDDGGVGAGKAKDADNIVSFSQSVDVELFGTVIDR